MDVIRELRWERWGPMVVRDVGDDSKILTPKNRRAQRYDLFREKRSLLDDLLEAGDGVKNEDGVSARP